ncbi:hypothetical protein IPdc08_00056 [archaeon]|nr:hypothetical protein IPdc08_00056 [archaeon]
MVPLYTPFAFSSDEVINKMGRISKAKAFSERFVNGRSAEISTPIRLIVAVLVAAMIAALAYIAYSDAKGVINSVSNKTNVFVSSVGT